jgi:23S rRNA (adenine1618-N6)-methyltransferase
MLKPRKEPQQEKPELHPRNKHRQRYNFDLLKETSPGLAAFVRPNDYGDESIDFFNPKAVKALNLALLRHYYNIQYWDVPENYLNPPIPGRADYIHYAADILSKSNADKIPEGNQIKCLDVGVGASCIYPIIGHHEYGWSFVGSDIDPLAITSAEKIITSNSDLKAAVELRLQTKPREIFKGIIQKDEKFDLTVCNPPFHSSAEEAQKATQRKIKNLKQKQAGTPVRNFGGQNNELWTEGGEGKFVTDMIFQSRDFATSCLWFTSLVSKESNLKSIYHVFKLVKATAIKPVNMGQGNKNSRIVAWTFLQKSQRDEWAKGWR